MLFVLQKEKDIDYINIDSLIVKKVLDEKQNEHTYIFMSYKELFIDKKMTKLKDKCKFKKLIQDAIPVGSIQFVNTFMKIFYNCFQQKPIEIPIQFQTYEFLKREYKLCSFESLPTKGKYFIKNVSNLKEFSGIGNASNITSIDNEIVLLDENSNYIVSEYIKNILSEYRIYVIKNKVANICCYKGKPVANIDHNFIEKIISICKTIKNFPKSYSIDIMLNNKGWSILEFHNFASLGLYSVVWEKNLLDAYIDGFKYMLKNNSKNT